MEDYAAGSLGELIAFYIEENMIQSCIDDIRTEQRKINYYTYIQSDEWKEKSDAAKERAGWHCQLCSKHTEKLNTHHNTYDRLGRERESDLIVLCERCHEKHHDILPEMDNDVQLGSDTF